MPATRDTARMFQVACGLRREEPAMRGTPEASFRRQPSSFKT
jgi:hypothetical protein